MFGLCFVYVLLYKVSEAFVHTFCNVSLFLSNIFIVCSLCVFVCLSNIHHYHSFRCLVSAAAGGGADHHSGRHRQNTAAAADWRGEVGCTPVSVPVFGFELHCIYELYMM